MILPIVAYGDPVLKKTSVAIKKDYENLKELIADMFETMYDANGVGLAAPQIGKAIRLFVVDAKPFAEDEPELENFKRVFINAEIVEEDENDWKFNEGCLSIPGIREDVVRCDEIVLKYRDENFKEHTETFSGIASRIIQHEYDHIEGVLFTDHLSVLKKRLLRGKLNDIAAGKVNVDYKMRFYKK
jgi:peptide deformylase